MNCWEFLKCGREPGGHSVELEGPCPAASFEPADGYLGGTNGGCACAFVTGTLCDETIQGTYRDKSKKCWDCPFYQALRREHGAAFSLPAFALYLRRRNPAVCRAFLKANGDSEK
jgi:hypothetical protein